MSDSSPRLGQRALSGLKWGSLGSLASVAFQLGFTAAMARLLVPADFGLVAMGALALRFFTYFAQLGLAAALVQKERLEDGDVRLALGLTWLVCGAAALGVALTAPALGWFFRTAEVVPIVRALSASLVVQGLAGVSMSLLRRQLRFRAQALVETGSYVVGYGLVGVTAAWAGAGVWSLVAAALAQSAAALALGWALTRHPLRPTLRGDRRALLGYGAPHSVVSFLEFLSGSVDAAIIGRLLGEAPLGLYNRALMLVTQPVDRASSMVAKVLFPVLSAAQADRRKVGSAWLLGVSLVGVFGGAVSLGLSAGAADAVRVLLGPRWDEAAPLVRVLALAAPLAFMSQMAGVTCDALALLRFKLLVQAGGLAAIATGMLLLYPAGPRGIAWALVIGEALRFATFATFLSRELSCARGDVARVLAGVALAAGLAFAACSAAAALARSLSLPAAPALGLEVAAGLLALGAGAWLALRLLDGTAPARLAESSLPGWERLRLRLRLSGARA